VVVIAEEEPEAMAATKTWSSYSTNYLSKNRIDIQTEIKTRIKKILNTKWIEFTGII
jgi:hypothetical protein